MGEEKTLPENEDMAALRAHVDYLKRKFPEMSTEMAEDMAQIYVIDPDIEEVNEDLIREMEKARKEFRKTIAPSDPMDEAAFDEDTQTSITPPEFED